MDRKTLDSLKPKPYRTSTDYIPVSVKNHDFYTISKIEDNLRKLLNENNSKEKRNEIKQELIELLNKILKTFTEHEKAKYISNLFDSILNKKMIIDNPNKKTTNVSIS